jgi:Uma2 family endonuclease
VYAVVEASKPHNRITGALYATLRHHLRGGPRDVYTLDMKVRVGFAGADAFYYPDVIIELGSSTSKSGQLYKLSR